MFKPSINPYMELLTTRKVENLYSYRSSTSFLCAFNWSA